MKRETGWDWVCPTNLNRQILATRKTVGKYKVDIARERIHEINYDCSVRTYRAFYLPETQDVHLLFILTVQITSL